MENWNNCWYHQEKVWAENMQKKLGATNPFQWKKLYLFCSSLSAIICLFLLTFIFCYSFSSSSFSAEPPKISVSCRTKTDFPWVRAKSFCMYVCVCVRVCVCLSLFYGNLVLTSPTRANEEIPWILGTLPWTLFLHTFLHKTHGSLRTLRFLSPLPKPSLKKLKVNIRGAPTSWRAHEVQFHLPFRSQTLVTPSSLCLIVRACCLISPRPGLFYILCQHHLFLFSSHPNLRQKTADKNIIRSCFLEQRPKQQVLHEKVMLRPSKSKGNPSKAGLKWAKCSFA